MPSGKITAVKIWDGSKWWDTLPAEIGRFTSFTLTIYVYVVTSDSETFRATLTFTDPKGARHEIEPQQGTLKTDLLKKLSEKAIERAKQFTWEKAVTQLEKALEEATKSPRLTMEILKQKKPINAPAYHPNLLKHIPQGKGLCLDAGCGRYAPYRRDIEAKGYKWIGVDARGGKDIQQIDLTKLPLPFKNKQFEYTWCCHVIEHIPKSKQPKLIQELKRVAKHGCIVAPAPNTPAYHLDPLHKGLNQKILKSGEATIEDGNIIIKW